MDSFTTRLPEKETIERLGNIFNLTVTASEKIYQEAKKVSKNRGKSIPDLEDINKILSESSLQRLTFNEMGGLSIDYEYKEPKLSKRKKVLKEKREIKSSPKNSSTKDQLKEYKELFDEGLISEEEYSVLKKKALDL